MGAPKQKWTPEEEAALRAGVDKYGPGKWRAIQKDPEYGAHLASRSNVDLKDKWRNMNVGSSGHGSREKSLKSLTRNNTGNGTDELIPLLPLASLPGGYSTDDTYGVADTLVSSDSSKDMNSLGPRYENLILEAILGLKDSNGSNSAAIASCIEDHHPVPPNFKRLLSTKLRDLTMQCKLVKTRQNYKVNDAEFLQSKFESPLQQEIDDIKQSPRDALKKMRGAAKGIDLESFVEKPSCDGDDDKLSTGFKLKKPIGEHVFQKARMDVDFSRSHLKTAVEAARAAALAVAEAEDAAAAAEQAAREAEAAEAEAEAAQIAAEIAALAARRPNKVSGVVFPMEEVAVMV